MNHLVKYFLPSQGRGVYRFDEMFSQVDDLSFEQFVENKLRFLPCSLIEPVQRYMKFEENFHEVSKQLTFDVVPRDPRQRRANFFFSRHQYFNNALAGQVDGDKNFLEIKFIQNILAPLLNEAGLDAVQPQKQIGPYWADFAFDGPSKLVIEIDGFAKFNQRQDLDNFTARQNYIVSQGWRIIRFTYGQIMNVPKVTMRFLHDILVGDSHLVHFLVPALAPPRQASLFRPLPTQNTQKINVVDFVNTFHRIQDWFVPLAINNPSPAFVLGDGLGFPLPLVGLALSSLYHFLDAVAAVVDVKFELPAVQINSSAMAKKWKAYGHPAITLTKRQPSQTEQQVTHQHIEYGAASLPAPLRCKETISFRKGLSLEEIHQRLDYITREVFGYPSGTNPFQDKVLQRIFDGQETLGISTTGSGKSFCFWLPALLKPGLTLVVAPLKSLMRDQKLTLQNYGISSMELINSEVSSSDQQRFMGEAKLGYLRLLYISPERLRIKKFVEQLDGLQEVIPINILAIDEAHCISEWGHDFRPSYLKLPSKKKELVVANPGLRLVALTATAGQMVEKDMRNILELDESDVLRESVADREYFSYQIVPVNDGESKTAAFRKILKNDLATALKQQSLPALLEKRNSRQEKTVGIVFCVYADPHGKNNVLDGTTHYLFETMEAIEQEKVFMSRMEREFHPRYNLDAFSSGKVRSFSSKTPTLCPNCYSYCYTSLSKGQRNALAPEDELAVIEEDINQPANNTAQKICKRCGNIFDAKNAFSLTATQWENLIKTNQNDFKHSRFDILVATKGFGMGIDKSSVRFVIHTSLSSGLESWYQEVGRAGRDNERAHIVLLADPPNDSCSKELATLTPKRPRCSWTGGCAHGRQSICDYGKQHIFITGSYPGAETDAISALRMLDYLLAIHQQTGANPVPVRFNYSDDTNTKELALYRLICLGLVEDYTITYEFPPRFEVILHVDTIPEHEEDLKLVSSTIRSSLFTYMRQWTTPEANYLNRIDRIRSEYKPLRSQAPRTNNFRIFNQLELFYVQYGFFNTVYEHLLLLLDHTYKDVVKMRYDMLWNLLDVVKSSQEKECQRVRILPYFEGSDVDKLYQCGCCNVCSPELDFRARVVPRAKNASHETSEIELNELLRNNDLNIPKLKQLCVVFQDYRDAKYRSCRAILAGDPNNLPALYLTWKFTPAAELAANTKRLLLTANDQCIPLSQLKELYLATIIPLRSELILLLNELGTTCDSLEGWEFLAQEAGKHQFNSDPKVAELHDCLDFFLLVEELPPETESLRNKALLIEEMNNA